jgi:pimeloyl-ACP methyl ester carboxylesterase
VRTLAADSRSMRAALLTVFPTAFALTASVAPGQERVSFTTPDSGVVIADVYGAGKRGVVLAHGGRFNRASWEPQARVIAAAGFRVVTIDFRGRGESRAGRAGPDGVHHDVLGAVRYLRANGAASVSVVGGSFGGGAAADAAAVAPGEIDRLVLLAHSPIDHPERVGGRKLFIIASGDTTASGIPRLVQIREHFERSTEPKELIVLDGTAHAQFLFQTDQGDRVMREILRFLLAP